MKIEGKKINLRTIRKSDADSIYKNIKDREILRWLLNPPMQYTPKDAEAFVLKAQKKARAKEGYNIGIEDKETKQIIGALGIGRIHWPSKHAAIGYWLGTKYHRRGIMNEALGLALNYCFKELKFHSVWASTFKENKASQNLLKKYGFRYVGVMKEFYWRNNRWNDDMMWQLLKKDYKK